MRGLRGAARRGRCPGRSTGRGAAGEHLSHPRRRLRPRRRDEPVRRLRLRAARRRLPTSSPTTTRAPGSARPTPTGRVRVLLGTGPASFSGRAPRAGDSSLDARDDLHGPAARRRVRLNAAQPRRARRSATLRRAADRRPAPVPLALAGTGSYRGALEFRPTARGGVSRQRGRRSRTTCAASSAGDAVAWPAEALKAQAVAARTYAITDSVGGTASTTTPTRARRCTAASRPRPRRPTRRSPRPAARSSPTTASRSSPTSSRPPAGTPRTSRTRSPGRRPTLAARRSRSVRRRRRTPTIAGGSARAWRRRPLRSARWSRVSCSGSR